MKGRVQYRQRAGGCSSGVIALAVQAIARGPGFDFQQQLVFQFPLVHLKMSDVYVRNCLLVVPDNTAMVILII